MRRDIEIPAAGVTLRGWFYVPRAPHPAPAVVMAPGFGGVKEQLLDRYAEVFAAAGIGALIYDPRNFGASGGEPRQEVEPWRQVEDCRDALTYAGRLGEVDAARLGVWGTSFGGGHALVVAAVDHRVRCAVSQIPSISGREGWLRRVQPAVAAMLDDDFDADRERRLAGEPPAMIPLVVQRPGSPCVMPDPEAWAFFDGLRAAAPAWRNEVTLRSLDLARAYEPGVYAPWVSPTPLLVVAATHDGDSPTDLVLRAYRRALEPKKLCLLPGGHFDVYTRWFERSCGAARDWLLEHLAGS